MVYKCFKIKFLCFGVYLVCLQIQESFGVKWKFWSISEYFRDFIRADYRPAQVVDRETWESIDTHLMVSIDIEHQRPSLVIADLKPKIMSNYKNAPDEFNIVFMCFAIVLATHMLYNSFNTFNASHSFFIFTVKVFRFRVGEKRITLSEICLGTPLLSTYLSVKFSLSLSMLYSTMSE